MDRWCNVTYLISTSTPDQETSVQSGDWPFLKKEHAMTDKELHCMDNINVRVKWLIFRNEREGFFITCCSVKDYPENVIATMNAVSVNKDDMFTLQGEWKNSSKYGWQFKAKTAIPNKAFSLDGLKKYLVDNVKGIGRKKAQELIDAFGPETENILNNEPEKAREVLNVSDKVFLRIINSWNDSNKESKYIIELAKLGITGKTAINIYKSYGENCVERIRKNPYALIDDVKRIGFKKADDIAGEMGIKKEDERRIDAGLVYTLSQSTEFGNTCLIKEDLISETAKIIEVDEELVNKECDIIINEGKVISDNGYIYIKKYYYEEKKVAEQLLKMNVPQVNFLSIADDITAKTGINYTKEQQRAIDMSINSKIMILTGGPGTGKTTTVKGMIMANEEMGKQILCAAPTGRASKRMQEATGREAYTIHRLLEFNGEGFQRNKDNPLGEEKKKYTLIIDESSMIDISLMASLLEAIPKNMSLILVGDVDQLPSVGPGTILRDIISSDIFPTARLTKIQRQAEGSDIINMAHDINNGRFPNISNPPKDVFSYNVTGMTGDEQLDIMIKCYMNALTKYSPMDVQILSPQHTGKLGTDNVNIVIRDMINKNGEKVPATLGDFRVGDKVMQTKNNYSLGVFNGDIGVIESYDDEYKTISVDFNGVEVIYDEASCEDLTLSYACTVHKSQGSEYPVVILPISTQHFYMLERNLIYTAVTRSSGYLICLMDKKALYMGVKKVNSHKRVGRMLDRLKT